MLHGAGGIAREGYVESLDHDVDGKMQISK
jgi:hypothetical protein